MNYTVLFPLTGEVNIGDKTSRLRPKTFLLAEYLSQRVGEVVSKEDILNAVWQDSIVEEQAVFQSINEIRKAFAPLEVIKTYPRKGYAWLIPPLPQEQHSNIVTPKSTRRLFPKVGLLSIILVSALIIGSTFWWWGSEEQASGFIVDENAQVIPEHHQALLILPIDTSELLASQHWLSIGAMEALLKGFDTSQHFTLFQVSDVLDILARVDDEKPEPKHLFEVSAATHIVESQISGVPGEYHLIYSLYQPQTRQQGQFHAQTIEDLLYKLREALASELNKTDTPARLVFNKQFNHSLMFNAVQLLATNDVAAAIRYLQSAIANEPNNLAGLFLLAKAYAQSQQFLLAIEAAEKGLALQTERTDDELYLPRLLYIKAVSQLALGQTKAKDELLFALETLTQHQDWLYVAYSKAMLAQYFLNKKQPKQALPLLQQSLSYQQMLGCPMGIAQGYLDFVDYYYAINDAKMATSSFQMAQKLVKEKGLIRVQPLMQQQSQKISQMQLKQSL